MKTAAIFLALFGSAAAFAPVSQSKVRLFSLTGGVDEQSTGVELCHNLLVFTHVVMFILVFCNSLVLL